MADTDESTEVEAKTSAFGTGVRLKGLPPWAIVAIATAALFVYGIIRIVELMTELNQ